MRRKLSFILAILLFSRLFCLTAAAEDHDHGDAEENFHQLEEVPFYVRQVDYLSRYAVDVIYSDMTIQVESAVWDVNDHYYVVTMEDMADNAVFSTRLTVVNHSDQDILANVDVTFNGEGLTLFEETSTVGVQRISYVPNNAEDGIYQNFQIDIVPVHGWTAYINQVIAGGISQDNICTVGAVTLTVNPFKES